MYCPIGYGGGVSFAGCMTVSGMQSLVVGIHRARNFNPTSLGTPLFSTGTLMGIPVTEVSTVFEAC